ncbi:hypothetical protein JCM8208_007117 [Rhodotorula glutinis]
MVDPFSAFNVGGCFPGWDGGYSFFKSVEEEALEDRFTFVPTWHVLSSRDDPDPHVEMYTIECDYHAAAAAVAGTPTPDRTCPYSIRVEQTSAGSTDARVVASQLEHDHALYLLEGVVEASMSPYALWRKWTEKDARPSILDDASNAIWYARRTFNGLKSFYVDKRKRAIEDQDRVVADVKRFFSGDEARQLLDESRAGKWLFTDDERKLVHGPPLVGPPAVQQRPRKKVTSSSAQQRASGAPSKKLKTSTTTTTTSHSSKPHVVAPSGGRLPPAQLAPEPLDSSPAVAHTAPTPASASASSSSSDLKIMSPQVAPVRPRKKPVEVLELIDSDEEDVKPVIQPEPEPAPAASHTLDPSLSQTGASLRTLFSSLSSTFDFSKYLDLFLHPDLDIDSAAQLIEVARSPALLDTLMSALEAGMQVGGDTGATLRRMPLVWRTALRQALEERVGRDEERR